MSIRSLNIGRGVIAHVSFSVSQFNVSEWKRGHVYTHIHTRALSWQTSMPPSVLGMPSTHVFARVESVTCVRFRFFLASLRYRRRRWRQTRIRRKSGRERGREWATCRRQGVGQLRDFTERDGCGGGGGNEKTTKTEGLRHDLENEDQNRGWPTGRS